MTVPGLRARTLRGFVLIGVQRALALLVTAAGGIVLARVLMPDVFGAYAMLGFVVGLGVLFSDAGLGAALIQRRELDAAASLTAAFAAQLALAAATCGALVLAAPVLAQGLGLGPDATAPLRALALLAPLSALRMPPAVLMERALAYLPLTLADALETLVFHGVAVVAALSGAGVWSFVLGALAARLAGLAVLWPAARWRPAVRWRWSALAPMLRFGLPFQGSAVVTMARDAAVPLFVGLWSGVTAVGLLSWAAGVAFLPLQVVSIAGRVLFPALSRLQHDPGAFVHATERALNRVATVLYPAALLLLAAAEPVVRLVYGEAWLPAVPAIRLFCLTALVGGTSSILVHALHGLGRADLVFRLNVFWTALLWSLTLVAVPWLGFLGFALASACVAATAPITALTLQRLAPVAVLRPVRVPFVAAGAAAGLLGALAHLWIHDVPSLLVATGAAAALYVGLAWMGAGAAGRTELFADWRAVWQGRA